MSFSTSVCPKSHLPVQTNFITAPQLVSQKVQYATDGAFVSRVQLGMVFRVKVTVHTLGSSEGVF